jgi:hypothetical protein
MAQTATAQKTVSDWAQVAKLIKQYCTKKGIKCRTRSESYSMGNSVNATIYDQTPEVYADVKAYASQFVYGQFNSMEDIYEYSNRRDDLPQSKYVTVDNDHSDELKQAAWEFIRGHYAEAVEMPQAAADLNGERLHNDFATTIIHRFLGDNNNTPEWTAEFWGARNPAAPEPVKIGESRIEEHTHTKRGFQMFIVIMADRVDRDEYLTLLDRAKSLGGWYSRKWGTTPAGFAFKERATAESFLSDAPANPSDPTPPNNGRADKFREMADKMQGDIDNKLGDRQTNTPKRQRDAGNARLDGERLQRTQEALGKLADLHDAGTIPPILASLASKKAVYELARSEIDHSGGYYDAGRCQGKPANDTPEALALWGLLAGKSDEDKQTDKLRNMTEALLFANIPGFFPTPSAVVDIMLDHARIEAAHSVLEPSAGAGAIADRLGSNIDCCEVWRSLQDILTAKGHNLIADDFMVADIPASYDRIVMNPPFEKLQDIDHVRKAYDCLADGGRLVSIMSPGPFFRSDAKSETFRAWFHELGGEQIDIPAGAFKESGTGVSSVLVVINKG